MSIVGDTRIRTDLIVEVEEKTPDEASSDLIQGGLPLRAEDVIRPFERARTTPVKTLGEFYELFKRVLDFAREYEGKEYIIQFAKNNFGVETILPCFTTKLISREPWSFKGRREMGPRIMEDLPDPDYPGDIIQREIRRQRNIIQLTVWGKDNDIVDELAEWVEEKFFEYLWAFQWAGLAHPVDWIGRGEDIYDEARTQGVHGAPLTFSVITAKITQKRASALRSLSYSLGLLSLENTPDS